MSKLHLPSLPQRLWVATHADVPATALECACALVTELLAAGPQPELVVLSQASVQSLSESTLKRAKQALAVQSEKRGGVAGREGSQWMWSLPATNGTLANIGAPSIGQSAHKTDLPAAKVRPP